MKQVHFFVSGSVQGVCYRHYATKKARELRLVGYIKNLSDGWVEVLVEGEERKVNGFLEFCRKNPAYSHVDKIEIEKEKQIKKFSFNNFEIRF